MIDKKGICLLNDIEKQKIKRLIRTKHNDKSLEEWIVERTNKFREELKEDL